MPSTTIKKTIMLIKFKTPRLIVSEASIDLFEPARSILLNRIPEILSPTVTKNLPPYFHDIESEAQAKEWYKRMVTESRLFIIEQRDKSVIGFLFAHTSKSKDVHIGYLLDENHWGSGLATELLIDFIELAKMEQKWNRLIGGVEQNNTASSHLLEKLGFSVSRSTNDESVVFYEYNLTRTN